MSVPPPPPTPYTVINGDPHRARARVPDVSQEEWEVSRARFDRFRGEVPSQPYVERVQLGIVDPRTGKVYQARGAVAISPGRAARLILVGPGGTTALDVWVTPTRFRLAVPSLKIQQRGTDVGETHGIPIGFMRWWLLSPAGGHLLLARSNEHESTFMLRDGLATVTMRTNGERIVAIRREGSRVEGLEWAGSGLVPQAGARGRYIDGEWGVHVHVFIEEVLKSEPDPGAFLDPDEQGTTL